MAGLTSIVYAPLGGKATKEEEEEISTFNYAIKIRNGIIGQKLMEALLAK